MICDAMPPIAPIETNPICELVFRLSAVINCNQCWLMVIGANMGAIWGQQDPGGPHAGPMNLAIWECMFG